MCGFILGSFDCSEAVYAQSVVSNSKFELVAIPPPESSVITERQAWVSDVHAGPRSSRTTLVEGICVVGLVVVVVAAYGQNRR